MKTLGMLFELNFILLGLCESREVSKLFRQALACSGEPACAFDTPLYEVSGTKSLKRCLTECVGKDFCVNFNYRMNTERCQLYDAYPYKLKNEIFCSNYDVVPREITLFYTGNFAIHQRTCQSTTAIPSWNAVDGNIPYSTCSHTNEGDSGNNWLMVDVQDFIVVSYVRILTTSGIAYNVRYKNLTIGVTNSSWFKRVPIRGTYPLCGVYLGPQAISVWIRINCTSAMAASRYIIVHQAKLNSSIGSYLSICELEVYG